MDKRNSSLESYNFDYYARYSYERLLFNQPHIKVDGLYYDAETKFYYIYCPEITDDTKAIDGTNIYKWFKENKVASCPAKITNTLPSDVLKIEERNIEQLINGAGTPNNLRNTMEMLYLLLPKDFPFIYLQYKKDQSIEIVVENPLTDKEKAILENAFRKLELPLNYSLKIDSKVKENATYRIFDQGDIEIIPSKFLSNRYSKSLKDLVEDDDYFWVEKRESILKGKITDPADVLPDSWDKYQSRCFLNASVFPQENIRKFLPIYDNIIIALPIAGREGEFLSSLNVRLDDLIQLATMGRVSFILPQSIDRYPLNLIEPLVEAAPNSFILTRKLTALSIIDNRIRFPFLYLPFGVKEKAYLLRILYSSIYHIKDDKLKKTLEVCICELGRIWSFEEDMINLRGAMSLGAIGLGAIIASVLKTVRGMERFIEFFSADELLQLGAPLFANVVPKEIEIDYVKVLANLYSGIRTREFPNFINNSSTILNGILTINSDAPVIELAKTFKGKDIERLRGIICEISEKTADKAKIDEAIKKFNKEIINFENRKAKLSKLDIIGLACIVGGILNKNHEVAIAAYLLKLLYNFRNNNDIIGEVCDYIDSIMTLTKPKIVFVSRIRSKLKS